jgi:hypothetical protein
MWLQLVYNSPCWSIKHTHFCSKAFQNTLLEQLRGMNDNINESLLAKKVVRMADG